MTGTVYTSLGVANYPNDPIFKEGKRVRSVFFSKTVTSTGPGSVNGDTLILAGPFTMDERILAVKGATPAMTSANSNDLGFWMKKADGTFAVAKSGGGAELWSAVDLSSALSYRELLSDRNSSLDLTKNVGDLLSLTNESMPIGGLYLGLRINTANTAASVNLNLEVVIEEANTH
jgi:hypothetical protein